MAKNEGKQLSLDARAMEDGLAAANDSKSVSPGDVDKSTCQQPEVRSPTSSTASSSDGEKENYLAKAKRGHKKLKRSLGSGFDLVELKVQHPSAHDSCPPGTSSISMGSRSLDENDSYGELPPEDDWRDGLFQCFSVFFPIGAMACFGTSVAQVQVMKELRWTAGSKCQSGLLLAVVAMLWLSVPVSFFFGLYLLGAGAVALVLLLEAYVAFRLRLVTRRRYDIEGSAVRDCLVSTLCTSCVTAQILRHLKGGGE